MQLLDSAKRLILAKGLSSFTMESLAREAGVSHPLIYKYFDTRLSLLHALLERESSHFNRELREQVSQASDYHELVRLFVSANFTQFSTKTVSYTHLTLPTICSV